MRQFHFVFTHCHCKEFLILLLFYKSTEILFHVDVVGAMFVSCLLLIDNVLHNTMLFVLPIDQCNHSSWLQLDLRYHKVLALLLFLVMLSIEVVEISIHLFIESIFVFIIILYKKKFELQSWNCKALQVQNDCKTYEWSDYKLCECGNNYKLYGW